MSSPFPLALIRELEHRVGPRVKFNRATLLPPVARAVRLVFCPREFDFPREHAESLVWADPCIDESRVEPQFPWNELPTDRPLAYCSFGSQSQRYRLAPALLRFVVDAFSARDDFFLVVSCPPAHARALTLDPKRVLVVPVAPQLALLRRSGLAITHAGFNTVKECAYHGVPMIALPLSHDQPRNAALVAFHGIGIALDPIRLTRADFDSAIDRARDSTEMRARCQHFSDLLQSSNHERRALAWLESVLDRSSSGRAEHEHPPLRLSAVSHHPPVADPDILDAGRDWHDGRRAPRGLEQP